jgi:uncharacterized protein
MRWLVDETQDSEIVSEIIRAVGGRVVGRTRLQKMFYLLDAAGFETNFPFEYRHYGPYSEKLARATSTGCLREVIREDEYATSWGGTYSVFSATGASEIQFQQGITALLTIANNSNPIDLELAATAIFLSKENITDPWAETAKRKPEKAQRIDSAKQLVTQLSAIQLPIQLPQL